MPEAGVHYPGMAEEAAMKWRWEELTEREREIAIAYVTGSKKMAAIGHDFGIGKRRVAQILEVAYRVLDCSGRGQLGFLLGQHWEEIKEK